MFLAQDSILPNYRRSTGLVDARFMHIIDMVHAPLLMRATFTRFAARVLHIKTMTWCSMCGTASPFKLVPFWNLGMSVCLECCSNHFISRWQLLKRYGLAMDTRICGKMLVEHMLGKVFVAYLSAPDQEILWDFSTDPDMTGPFAVEAHTFFVWLPQLAELLDLPALALWQQQKKDVAAKVLAPWFKQLAVKRVVIAAQKEGGKRVQPSKLFTMNTRQKATFLEHFRLFYIKMLMAKKKKPRRRNESEHVFGLHTREIISMLELNEKGMSRAMWL